MIFFSQRATSTSRRPPSLARRNAAARQHATLLIQGVGSEGRNLMVSGEGSARIPHGNDAQETNRPVRAKYIRPEALDALDRALGAGRWRVDRDHADPMAVVDRSASTRRGREQLDTHPTRTPGWTKHDAWAMSSYVSAGGLDGIGRD